MKVFWSTKHQQDQYEPMECEEEEEIPDDPMNEEETPTSDAQEDRLVFQPQAERSRRTREPMLLLENISDAVECLEGSEGPPSPERARIDDDGLLAEAVLAYAVSVGEESGLPTTYAQSMASDETEHWRQAMNAKYQSHRQNRIWTLFPRESVRRTIGCRWAFAKKRCQKRCIVRYKARLVAKGFKQLYGVDFFEAYFPVANLNSVQVVLAVCAVLCYKMEQLNVDTPFSTLYMDSSKLQVPGTRRTITSSRRTILNVVERINEYTQDEQQDSRGQGDAEQCFQDEGSRYGEVNLGHGDRPRQVSFHTNDQADTVHYRRG
ncbi:retrotransposon ty1-copia subclass [Plasmopara halstedii]|uniref:Retrotransposon ty1-copia subclass n=1 Tax=Plasmopara halstedii TaxID=4781 RepID=A0A0P1AQF0_PLAHL|nr:retrotransposon ty1-copia subclass [Plasmopara halstedii]CEG43760.1 retrotransposon ty1-copia subclass [Plasmopara halstedii]|eukprot:XP_024580129.1 retrotransposon ty1-copia subclass [Plasmopara halstedii]